MRKNEKGHPDLLHVINTGKRREKTWSRKFCRMKQIGFHKTNFQPQFHKIQNTGMKITQKVFRKKKYTTQIKDSKCQKCSTVTQHFSEATRK